MPQKSVSYLPKLALFLLVYSAGFVLLFLLQVGIPTESSRWIYELSQKKTAYANSIAEKKILIVSGSNGLFGLRADIIEKETHIRTVNMAIHAGLGIQYILDQARRVAKPGDIIIMPLEYPLYEFDGTPPFESIDYILSRDPEYFYDLPLQNKISYFTALTPTELFARVRKIFKPDPQIHVGYQSATLDSYGDETLNKSIDLALKMRKKVNGFHPVDYHNATFDTKGTEEIKTFSEWCSVRDIKLLATFPSFIYFPKYKLPLQSKFYDGILEFYKNIGVPVLGTAYDFMYEKENFFDTNYHLKWDAAKKRTYQLLTLLKSKYPALSDSNYHERQKKILSDNNQGRG